MMSTIKRKILIVLIIILVSVTVLKIQGYNIIYFSRGFENYISDTVESENVEILNKFKIDDTLLVFFTHTDDNIGISYGKCKLIVFCRLSASLYGLGETFTTSEVIDTIDGPYMIIFGETTKRYSYITYTVEDNDYSSTLYYSNDYFISYGGLPRSSDRKAVAIDIEFK